jgi:acetylornithine deacetylase/succinyl-diaminopimelate desuccinylase-like protein
MSKVADYIEANRQRFIDDLLQLCAIPSVMGEREALEQTAALVAQHLRTLGADVQMLPTPEGPPVVFGEIGSGARSILSYSHYDVQPAEHPDAWISPPFAPTVRDGKVFGRGVGDDKGDFLARVQAVETYQAIYGPLPLRFKFFVEGEEEQGSGGVPAVAEAYRDLLLADGSLWEGANKDSAGRYTLYAGMKGGVFCELVIEGPGSDVHSAYAPLVENPAWRLVQALATLRAPDGRLTLDGLMDHWRPPTQAELDAVAGIPFDGQALRRLWQINSFVGGADDDQALVNFIYQPTCNICGLTSGYQGKGVKSIVPSRASVKLDLRLVPDLTPELILDLLRQHLDRRGYTDIDIHPDLSLRASRSSIEHPFVQTAIQVAEEVYGEPPAVYPNHGGSGPMSVLCDDLGMPGISAGVGYDGMNMHAPNENIRLVDYFQGIEYVVALIKAWAQR